MQTVKRKLKFHEIGSVFKYEAFAIALCFEHEDNYIYDEMYEQQWLVWC